MSHIQHETFESVTLHLVVKIESSKITISATRGAVTYFTYLMKSYVPLKNNFRAKAKMLKNTKMLDYMKEICDDLSEMGDDMSEMVGDIDDNRTQILKEYTEKKEKIQGMRLIMNFILVKFIFSGLKFVVFITSPLCPQT